MKPPKDAEVHEFETVYRWFDDEGNICVVFKEDHQPSETVEEARKGFEKLAQFLDGKKANFIFGIDNAKPSKKKVRDYTSKEFPKYVNAFAFVGTKPMTRMIVNVFFAFKKPPYPTAIFPTEEKAREWLRQYPVE